MNDPHNLRLPYELLSYTFRFAAPRPDPDFSPCSSESREQFKQAMAAPLTFGAVCRYWRDVAQDTPQLWTFLLVPLKPSHALRHLDLKETWLKRSKSLSLSIFVYAGASVRLDDMENVVAALNSCSDRWQSLALCAPDDIFRWFSGDPHLGSRLKSLKLASDDEEMGADPKFEMMNAHTQPTDVYMDQVRFNSISVDWSNVTRVEIFNLPVDEFFEVLKHARQLSCCKVSSLKDSASPLAEDTTHPNLRELHFECSLLEDFDAFFTPLILPSLEIFSFGIEDADDVWLPVSLSPFISRSSSQLKKLKLSEVVFIDSEIIALCETIPSLEHLELQPSFGSAQIQGELLKKLAESSLGGAIGATESQNFLPKLRHLRYDVVNAKFNWDLVPAIFGDLFDLDNPRRRPLTSLFMQIRPTDLDSGGDVYTPIGQASLASLRAVLNAGVNLVIVGPDEKRDLLKISTEGSNSSDEETSEGMIVG